MKWRVLGPVEAIADDRPIPVGRPQHRAVLAFLLLNANRAVSVEQLIEALWGGAAPSTARTQVHGCVSRLRHNLRAAGLGEALVRGGGGYRLDVAGGDLDLAVFADLVARAREVNPVEAAGLL
ncbi:AfsR/SARP family transcriptional regulator, partial [Allorhizocola rhizosphaerae]|uniref:AfsR/SARP family transcriptional regulator n=1 Tax=Allorhizocola rhizosphaerae TaxID=1872709 RepID=UPI0014786B81